ncbi:hypothetical protein D9758_005238 [Tetrapyrgos nigripes]|uniref:Cytochrome P450 n=1 Tax=Tetrapyrgos nigripes TaxID=182062 RepID=A0A8H5LX55_9AGAR|nr:hypothetical protein D9758_005238 [Tetrapyrgos nigripes]
MLDLVQLARSWLAGDDKDKALDAALLRNLVEGNNDEAESNRLDDRQLLSNAFAGLILSILSYIRSSMKLQIFLVAGHETTAHSLSFMIAEVQCKVREEVLRLTGGDPTVQLSYKEHMSKLVYTLAVFYETGRLCTVATRLGRRVLSDTTLTSRRFEIASDGSAERVQEFDVSLKRGSQVIVDLTAVHRNPIHWGRDVNEFKPERFIDTDTYRWPRNAFLEFSTGHRSCIRQKFSTTESLCLVANLLLTPFINHHHQHDCLLVVLTYSSCHLSHIPNLTPHHHQMPLLTVPSAIPPLA